VVIAVESGLRHKDCGAADRLAVVEQHAGYGWNASVLVRSGIACEQIQNRQAREGYSQ
jgi:hypothetical protein